MDNVYRATPLARTDGSVRRDVPVDAAGNQLFNLAAYLNKSDLVTAHAAPGDSRVAITASAQIGAAPGILKGFWIISHTAGATIRFSDALTSTTPYVGSAFTTVAGTVNGTYIQIAQDGLQMATGCYCTITGTCEILLDFKTD